MHENLTKPKGELSLQVIALPKDTNWNGDIFGGWLVSQMDLAGAVHAHRVSRGRVATVAINNMVFRVPGKVGQVLACHTEILKVGNTSIQVLVEVWESNDIDHPVLMTHGVITYVAIDDNKQKRVIPKPQPTSA